MEKRSLSIAGHRTSLALEAEFWSGLEAISVARQMPLAALIREIDETRDNPNLSSAIRVYVLENVRDRANGARRPEGELHRTNGNGLHVS